jgi:HK97 family phage portal protein
MYCWRGEGVTRRRVDSVWQARLFARPDPNPQQTRFDFWETLEESMCYRGNSYAWKIKSAGGGQVLEMYALHPDQVTVEKDGSYTVVVASGYVDPTGEGPGKYKGLDGGTIIHVRGHGNGGQLIAPTPIEVFREKMAGPVGRQRHEARMWRRGTALQSVIVFPKGVSKSQADVWKEGWRGNHEGTEGDTTAILGDGAELKPIGMTMADAKFVEMAHLTIEDAALIAAMPADMLGVPLTTRQPQMEDVRREWLTDGLNPELARIESAFEADLDFFGGAQTYPGFDTDGFVRGDNQTEAAIVVGDVQAGIITPNEGRAIRGYPPLPGGDKLQLTPVGGAPNPNTSSDSSDEPD